MLRARSIAGTRLGVLAAGAWRPVALAGVGVASLLVYGFGLIQPFSLFKLGLPPHVDVASLTFGRPAAQLDVVLTYVALFLLYYLAWHLCRPSAGGGPRQASRWLWGILLATLAAVNLAMLSLYPIGAVDVFDYIAQGREISVWHGNPFYTPAIVFHPEPVLRFTGWATITTLYGPAWQLLAAGLTWLAGRNLLINLLAFKLLAVVFYAGCVALIAAILRRAAPERALAGVVLFGLNPLVIYETAGNAHNDVVMVFCMLLGLFWLLRERHTLAALAFTLGLLTKLLPGLLLPILLVYSLSRLPDWNKRLRFLLGTGLACGLLVAAVAGPFWRGGDMLSTQTRLDMLTTSLLATVETLLEPRLGASRAIWLVGHVSLGIMVASAVLAAGYVWRQLMPPAKTYAGRRGRPEPSQAEAWLLAVQASTVVVLIYLLVACLWYQAWYSIWPLALGALLPEGALATLAVLLSVIGIWKPIYFNYFLNRPRLLPQPQRELRLGPMVFGLAWLFTLWALAWRLLERFAARRRPVTLRNEPGHSS